MIWHIPEISKLLNSEHNDSGNTQTVYFVICIIETQAKCVFVTLTLGFI